MPVVVKRGVSLVWAPSYVCEPTEARDSGGADTRDAADLWDITWDSDACCDADLRDETFEA